MIDVELLVKKSTSVLDLSRVKISNHYMRTKRTALFKPSAAKFFGASYGASSRIPVICNFRTVKNTNLLVVLIYIIKLSPKNI